MTEPKVTKAEAIEVWDETGNRYYDILLHLDGGQVALDVVTVQVNYPNLADRIAGLLTAEEG